MNKIYNVPLTEQQIAKVMEAIKNDINKDAFSLTVYSQLHEIIRKN